MNILEDKYCATIEKLEKANEVIEACKAKEIYHCNEMEMLKQKMKNLLSVEEEVSALKLQVMRANDHATKAEECVTDLEKKLDEQILTNRSHTDLFKKELANTYENLNNINIVLKQMNTKSSNLGQLRPDMKTNIGRDEFSTTRTRMEFTSTPELCEKGGTVQAASLHN